MIESARQALAFAKGRQDHGCEGHVPAKIRRILLERLERLQAETRRPAAHLDLRAYLEKNVWPMMPPAELGRVVSREQEEQILGYGPEGF